MSVIQLCPFCNNNLSPFWSEPCFAKCGGCDLLVRSPFPSERDLRSLYETSWTIPNESTSETGAIDTKVASRYADQLLHTLDIPNFRRKLILDFGAGKGTLMGALSELGATTYGVEPYGYGFLVNNYENVYQTLNDIPDKVLFDGIVSMDVVEHLRTPWECITELYNRLRPGGWLFISTPNPNGLNAFLTKQNWREAAKPGHILFMSEKCLFEIFGAAGFSQIRPLHWKIRYSDNYFKRASDYMLQNLSLDGATRMIGFRTK